MSNDTDTTTETTPPQVETPAPAAVETPSEGTQPSGEVEVTPAPEKQGSDHIPMSRFKEVIAERNAEREEKRQLMALLQQQRPQAQAAPQTPAEPQSPKQEDFSTYEEFIRADAQFVAEQAAEKRWNALQAKQQSEQRQQSEQQVKATRLTGAFTEFNKAATEYAAKNPSFAEIPMQPLFDLGEDLFIAALETKNPQLLEQIATTPGLSRRLASMHPLQAGREIWTMEQKLAGSSGQPPKKPSANIPSLSPVGAGKGPGSKHANDLTTDDVTRRLYPI